MAELKQALEKSEDSIWSLETKLETVKAVRINDSNVGCESSQTESVIPFQKSDGVESSSKESLKDGLSAGSFTQETRTNWSPRGEVPASPLLEEPEIKKEVPISPKHGNVLGIGNLAGSFTQETRTDWSPTCEVLAFPLLEEIEIKREVPISPKHEIVLSIGNLAGSFTQETRTNWSPRCKVPASPLLEETEIKKEVPISPKHENILGMGDLSGSFTQETRTNWSPRCEVPASPLLEETETKTEVLISPKHENVLDIGNLAGSFTQETRTDWSPTCEVLAFPLLEEIEINRDVPISPKHENVLSIGNLAGSFTQDSRTNWSPRCEVPASLLLGKTEIKKEVLIAPKHEKILGIGNLAGAFCIGHGGSIIRRRRGKRKRKDCIKDMKEGSVGDSDFWGSTDVLSATRYKDNSTSTSCRTGRFLVVDDKSRVLKKDEHADLVAIFNSIAENKCATVFRRRLDSQRRGRYKKMILQHVDFDTLRSRISSHTITSLEEVFRDMLLLANNVLVFYSKTTREYKSALLLREIVTKSLRQHLKNFSKTPITLLLSKPQILDPPVKPCSTRPAYRTRWRCRKLGTLLRKVQNRERFKIG